jgi:ubiquinone/menaquinone biosynthesis C-methylase UbiE
MTPRRSHEAGTPMPHACASRLLNPIRGLALSPATLVRRPELRPDLHVLELGPGPGYFSPAVARVVAAGRLVLVDIQPEMLDMARACLDARGLTNIEYRCGDAMCLPAESESFDVAFLLSVLGEIPDRNACLREIRRVLRPGGLLSVTEFSVWDPDAIPGPELEALVQAARLRACSRHGNLLHDTLGFRETA